MLSIKPAVRQNLLVIFVNAVVFAGLLAGLEFGVRAMQRKRLGPNAMMSPARLDRWTGWRNNPSYSRRDIEHNAQGFRRSSAVSLEKSANTVRIFVMGGSAAYGAEGQYRDLDPDWKKLYNKDLIDAYLERKLQQRHPERQWEVINGAVSEFRMHQEQVLLYAQILQYHPDLVIFMDGHNDMSGFMGVETSPYNPYLSTPHEAEFETMTKPHSLRSLFYINSMWLRSNSAFFDLLYRKSLDRLQPDSYGPGVDPNEHVTSPVRQADLTASDQVSANRSLSRVGYYLLAVERLRTALELEHIPSVFSLQPELLTTSKKLTSTEIAFADHTRQISRRRLTYLWENLRPAIVREMAEAASRQNFTFVDLNNIFDSVTEKVFTDYCHLTPKGNEQIAEKLLTSIEPSLIPELINKTRAAE
ncbi:MAG: hypothetical protein JWN34_5758 [Bryobacterales bacterium]|nr:hypothetical protein [Bryobacterales bacterium]